MTVLSDQFNIIVQIQVATGTTSVLPQLYATLLYCGSSSPCCQPFSHTCWNSLLWCSCQDWEGKICYSNPHKHLPGGMCGPIQSNYIGARKWSLCPRNLSLVPVTCLCNSLPMDQFLRTSSCCWNWYQCCSWVSSSGIPSWWWPNPFAFFSTHQCGYSGVWRAYHYFFVPFWSWQPIFFCHWPTTWNHQHYVPLHPGQLLEITNTMCHYIQAIYLLDQERLFSLNAAAALQSKCKTSRFTLSKGASA